MPATYAELRATIFQVATEFTGRQDMPNIETQWGGHFDGADRAFVVPTWGRSLFPAYHRQKFLQRVQAVLAPHLACELVLVRGAGAHTLIVTSKP